MISERIRNELTQAPRTLDEAGWSDSVDIENDADSPGLVAALAGVLIVGVLLWGLLVMLFSVA